MLSWIRNLHTCKTDGFCWHGRVWPALGPCPIPTTAEAAPLVLKSLPSAPPLQH